MSSSASLMDTTEAQKNEQAQWFDLKLDRNLLDASFDGYKLSLDQFVHYKLKLDADFKLNTFNLIESNTIVEKHKFLLYQHLKLYSQQNLLFVNHFNDSHLYYFDTNLRLNKIIYDLPKILPTRAVIPTNLKLENYGPEEQERAGVSLKFISESLAVIFDGYKSLYICQLDTSNKTEDPLVPENWSILHKWQASPSDKCQTSLIKDAILYENEFHVMLMNVQEEPDADNKSSRFDTLINWLTFECNNGEWNIKRTRRVNCNTTVPDYVAFETNGRSIYIAGTSLNKFVYDSQIPVEVQTIKQQEKVEPIDLDKNEKFYTWNQNNEEVNVNVCLNTRLKKNSDLINKNDLKVNLTTNSVDIEYLNETILKNDLFGSIKSDESVWTLNSSTNQIELLLSKANPGQVWTSFLKDNDAMGEYKMDTNEDGIKIEMPEESKKPLFELDQQLEECDGMNYEPSGTALNNEDAFQMLRRLDGDTHEATHKCYINDNRFLFEVKLSPNKTPALCLRHDVDGIVWQPHRVSAPSPSDTVWLSHEHTFLAFGYVQASKQDAKFKMCPPDLSYVCVLDAQRHIYIYKQDSEKLNTQLKNRKTGKIFTHVAKQFLISIDSESDNKNIYGCYCSNEYLIVLLSDSCLIYRININN